MYAYLQSGGAGAAILVILFLIVAVALYFLPTIVAVMRKVPNVGSVVIVNLFLGWSFIGWVVAMAMAARSAPTTVVAPIVYGGPGQPMAMQPFAPSASAGGALAPGPPPAAAAYAAGWYPDPPGQARLRYHDGNAWTSHTHE